MFKLSELAKASKCLAVSLCVATFALSGCGGGGGGDESSDHPPEISNPSAVGATAEDAFVETPATEVTSVVTTPDQMDALAQEDPEMPMATSTPPSQPAEVVQPRADDVLVTMRARLPEEVAAGRLQCMGANITGSQAVSGVHGTAPDGSTHMKHGVVSNEPGANAAGRAFYFRLTKNDPNTSGATAQRCERYFNSTTQFIPQRTDIWFGVRTKVSEWDNNTYRVIWQWHDNGAGTSLLPHLAAMVNGRNLRLIAQFNNNTNPTTANTTSVLLFSTNQWQSKTWNDFVVKAKVDPSSSGSGYVQVWLNGVRVVNYRGPIGYRYDSPKDYAKIGLYHWNSATNSWRTGATETIAASYSGMVMLKGASRYSAESVRSMLQ